MRILPFAIALTLGHSATAEPLKIVTDIAPIHSLVVQVTGAQNDVSVLVSGAASPHDFQFSFTDADAVQNADLVIWAGHDLTPWLEEPLETLAPDTTQIALLETPTGTDANGWLALPLRDEDDFAMLLEQHGDHDHDHDHDHGSKIDPHAWLDPDVARAWVTTIETALIDADPQNAEIYRANAETTRADLEDLAAGIETKLAAVSPAPFLVPHDAYQYFGNRFGLPALAAITLSDANTPSPDKIADLQDVVTQTGVVCVLSDPQTRIEWVDLVREGTTARTALADPLGSVFVPGPDHYAQTITAMADAYVSCLDG